MALHRGAFSGPAFAAFADCDVLQAALAFAQQGDVEVLQVGEAVLMVLLLTSSGWVLAAGLAGCRSVTAIV